MPTIPKTHDIPTASSRLPHHESLRLENNLSLQGQVPSNIPQAKNKRLSVVAEQAGTDAKRDSQVSTASTASASGKGKRKTHVGPWQLGRTLGKGATGRVRLAKHALTGQQAAVKIVSKRSAAMVQSTSMARMDNDDTFPKNAGGMRTMPFGIEREVAIMKLIEHPNIIHLYDIWENRGELYLVMEHVEGGELFDYVSCFGALPEHEAVRLFRQIISGLSYCHNLSLCHRDLKPENILIDAHRNIKLADFGMAALQPSNRWLNTSCGSPHYAAPEIIHGRKYRGDQVDIWSVGIILFAMLNGFLPFDGGDLNSTLRLVKRGEYYLPPTLSVEASDLIQRILQKRPEDRITMDSIWKHPLMKKYEALHASQLREGEHLAGPPPALSTEDCGYQIESQSDIDSEILRNLTTLWHGEKREEVVKRLLSEEPNREKLFYKALLKFREEQLENYPGNLLQHSASDHHHLTKSQKKTTKRATGTQGRSNTRHHSQYSIVSDEGKKRDSYYKNPITATSTTTKGSYDPFRASRTPIVGSSTDGPTVVIRRDSNASSLRNGVQTSSVRATTLSRIPSDIPELPMWPATGPDKIVKHKRQSYSTATSRSSLMSQRSKVGMRKSVSYRRQVSFQHKSQRSASQGSSRTRPRRHDRTTTPDTLPASRPESRSTYHDVSAGQSNTSLPIPVPRVRQPKTTSELVVKKPRVTSHYWKDDARKASSELGKICEDAFNRSSVSSSDVSHRYVDSPITPTSVYGEVTVPRATSSHRNRALPKAPAEVSTTTSAIGELVDNRRRIVENWGNGDPNLLAEIVARIDQRIDLETKKQFSVENRSASDPTHADTDSRSIAMRSRNMFNGANTIHEGSHRTNDNQRSASDPLRMRGALSGPDATIRMVSPDPTSPIATVEPLHIRKNGFLPGKALRVPTQNLRSAPDLDMYGARAYGKSDLDTIEEHPVSPRKQIDATLHHTSRKWSWLGRQASIQENVPPTPPKKNSPGKPLASAGSHSSDRSASEDFQPASVHNSNRNDEAEVQDVVEKKRRWFQKMFGKSNKAKDSTKRNASGQEIADDVSEEAGRDEVRVDPVAGKQLTTSKVTRGSYPPATSVDAAAAAAVNGPITVSQNWFARFLRIKPASRIILLQLGKTKGRKELFHMLKGWKQYGLRDVVIERRSGENVIRARVDADNYLKLKPVYFHAQIFAVLEHGRKVNLSIVKFTQEKGAASSFYKVIDTLQMVLKERDLMVVNSVQKKGLERTIKEAGW